MNLQLHRISFGELGGEKIFVSGSFSFIAVFQGFYLGWQEDIQTDKDEGQEYDHSIIIITKH